MPSASVRLLAARFSVTGTTERRRSLSLRPTSLAHRNSLVEAGSVPSLAPAAILAIHSGAWATTAPAVSTARAAAAKDTVFTDFLRPSKRGRIRLAPEVPHVDRGH